MRIVEQTDNTHIAAEVWENRFINPITAEATQHSGLTTEEFVCSKTQSSNLIYIVLIFMLDLLVLNGRIHFLCEGVVLLKRNRYYTPIFHYCS